jgi:hypothetical protein
MIDFGFLKQQYVLFLPRSALAVVVDIPIKEGFTGRQLKGTKILSESAFKKKGPHCSCSFDC